MALDAVGRWLWENAREAIDATSCGKGGWGDQTGIVLATPLGSLGHLLREDKLDLNLRAPCHDSEERAYPAAEEAAVRPQPPPPPLSPKACGCECECIFTTLIDAVVHG